MMIFSIGRKCERSFGHARQFSSASCLWQGRKFPYFPEVNLKPKKHIKIYGYALLVFPISFFGLGCWQVRRRQWKKDLLKQLKERLNSEPLTLPENLRQLENLEFSPIRVRGTFDYANEILIPMRTRKDPDFMDKKYHFMVDQQSPIGVHVVTPFKLADRDYKILINRGWLPKSYAESKSRSDADVNGEIEIVGIYRLNEKRPPFVMENKPFKNQWFYRDVNEMAKFLNTAPVYLEATADSTVRGGPVGGQTTVQLPDNHATYIFTWWTLSFLTSYLWYSMFF